MLRPATGAFPSASDAQKSVAISGTVPVGRRGSARGRPRRLRGDGAAHHRRCRGTRSPRRGVDSVSQLYDIDTDAFSDVTDTGIGIPRRKPRLTAWQLQLVRVQLESGACLAAFDAGIHRIVDVEAPITRRVALVEIEHDGAVPGLRT